MFLKNEDYFQINQIKFEKHLNKQNNILKSLIILIFLSYLIVNVSCQEFKDYSNETFITKILDDKIKLIKNHSINLYDNSLENLTLENITDSEKNYSNLKSEAQTICQGLKTILSQKKEYNQIKSIFPTFIKNIREVFQTYLDKTNSTSTNSNNSIYFYWLDEIPDNNKKNFDLYNYSIDNIFLIFPVIFIVIFGLLYISIFNCLYCRFCYFCGFVRTTILQERKYFNKLTFLLCFFGLLFVVFIFLIQQRISSMNQYIDYLSCEILNKNVIAFLSNQDYANYTELKGSKGLIELYNNFNKSYMKDIQNFKNVLTPLDYVGSNDPMKIEKESVLSGIKQFEYYVNNNNFTFIDENGKIIPEYNLTYKCLICKSLLKDVQQTMTRFFDEYYFTWHSNIAAMNSFFYKQLKSDSGWQNIDNYNKKIINLFLKIVISGEMYGSYVYETSDETKSFFNSNVYYILILLVIALIVSELGIYFSYLSFEQVVKEKFEISNNVNVEKGTSEIIDNAKLKNSWNKRYFFHLSINFSMITVLIANFVAYNLLLYSLYSYDLVQFVNTEFYSKNKTQYFKYHPYGEIVDECKKNTDSQTLFKYFTLDKLKSYWLDNFNNLFIMNNSLIRNNFTDFVNLSSQIDNLQIDQFIHNKDENTTINWDLDDEQINYFLFELPVYKQFSTRPNETLQYFTDYSINVTDVSKISQKNNCKSSSTQDVYTSEEKKCKNFFANYTYLAETTQVMNKQKPQACFRITMSTDNCIDTDLQCFSNSIFNRYRSEDYFTTCDVPPEELTKMNAKTTIEYFKNKIILYLTVAKSEVNLKNNLLLQLNEYKSNFNNMIKRRVQVYIKKLFDVNNEYMKFMFNFIDMIKYFESNVIKLNDGSTSLIGYESYLDCKILDLTNIFSFGTELISTELYGIGLLIIVSSFFLFILGILNLKCYFNLLSRSEVEEVKKEKNVIQAIEDKERQYFMDGSYIDEDDKIFMNIDLIKLKKKEENENKKIIENERRKTMMIGSGDGKMDNPPDQIELNNDAFSKKPAKKNIFKDFINKQLQEHNERFDKKKYAKKSTKYANSDNNISAFDQN